MFDGSSALAPDRFFLFFADIPTSLGSISFIKNETKSSTLAAHKSDFPGLTCLHDTVKQVKQGQERKKGKDGFAFSKSP